MVGNFGDIPKEYSNRKNAKIVILPVPYDDTSTWMKGADKGPAAIIEASAHMELYDIDTDSEVYKQGIFTDSPVTEKSSPEMIAKAVRERVAEHLRDRKFVVAIGGEHSITIGAVQAYANAYNDFYVLQLDAHSDLREEYEGSKYSHACVIARIKDMCPVVQVGIRSMDASEKENNKKNIKDGRVFFAKDIYNSIRIHDNNKDNKEKDNKSNEDWIDQVIAKLSRNVYITIDLDVFDPSLLPATGTPEPGGLDWYTVIELLKRVVEERNVVGFDVVELCPTSKKDSASSAFTAAKLIYSILSYKFAKK